MAAGVEAAGIEEARFPRIYDLSSPHGGRIA
jgi:hypothetical protein